MTAQAFHVARVRYRYGPASTRGVPRHVHCSQGFARATAEATLAAGEVDAVAFGQLFIANPDLPERAGAPLSPWKA
jgi:2,4-dienoyl-CoA reductase-like NADH-dependent reductase (Old Yellow Enzyme family)